MSVIEDGKVYLIDLLWWWREGWDFWPFKDPDPGEWLDDDVYGDFC